MRSGDLVMSFDVMHHESCACVELARPAGVAPRWCVRPASLKVHHLEEHLQEHLDFSTCLYKTL